MTFSPIKRGWSCQVRLHTQNHPTFTPLHVYTKHLFLDICLDFRFCHPSNQTSVYIVPISKQSQYSVIHSTQQLPFYFSSSTGHSHQTFQTLHLKNIHFPSLSTSYSPCLFSVGTNNYSFI